jgi:glycosyltransferase involved in cell wall biosynthesis
VEGVSLNWLYSHAAGLIFPSLQEGFGWPILEAQACGCPVFTSNRAPMTEVGGDAAVYFDPTNPQAAAQVIAAAMNRRNEIKMLGLRNVSRFSAEAMLDGYLASYQKALADQV